MPQVIFSNLIFLLRSIFSVFITAIVGTLQGVSSGDDRAHNAALAIDLYNSIPPDLKPVPVTRELGPVEDVNLFERAPYKLLMHRNLELIMAKRPRRNRSSTFKAKVALAAI
jgi:hypothetical protein